MKTIISKLVTSAASFALATAALTELPSLAAESVSVPVTSLKYGPTGVINKAGLQLFAAPAYGDLSKGQHGTFVKMPAGFVSDTHIHTHDYYAAVISGVGVNSKPGAKDVPLPVGSYWLQKGGEPHVTKCISPNECIFFINQADAFDYLPPKK